MDSREVFLAHLNEVRELVQNEISLSVTGNGNKSVKQLKIILDELEKMEKAMSKDIFAPYYPRGIADSWDFHDILGTALMDLAMMYSNL